METYRHNNNGNRDHVIIPRIDAFPEWDQQKIRNGLIPDIVDLEGAWRPIAEGENPHPNHIKDGCIPARLYGPFPKDKTVPLCAATGENTLPESVTIDLRKKASAAF